MGPRRRGGRGLRAGEVRAAWLFAAPAFLIYLAFLLVPVLATLAFSLTEVDRLTWRTDFVGLENFLYIWSDAHFWRSFANTFQFIALAVTGNVGLGLLVAVLLDRQLPKVMLYALRFAYFLPVLVASALVSLVWKFLYSTDLGILNYYLHELGLPGPGWLSDGRIAMVSVVIMDVWKHFGFFMIILLAALQAVPRSLIEAAALDGAGGWRIFWHIKLPAVAPVLLFCITYATIGGLQVFDSVRIMTNGGPGDATRVVVLYMYEQTFGAQDLGTGSAAAFTLLVVIAAVTAVQFGIGRRLMRS
ncbi:MAG: sugar ABC transporter permease [Proteobacteria bacterium]|nr:sugar ABC transporter permease [Pseudomonadota bacterium]MBI3495763.1 sugar ABC transporter permease [Pseudomonadota bacterium]